MLKECHMNGIKQYVTLKKNKKNEREIPKPDNGYLLTMKNTNHF